jgi:1-acyl-sn-glycerol-3-phosphate acyltransferase
VREAVPRAFERPSERTLRLAYQTVRPLEHLASPVFEGLERIPSERPLLFVGNHTLFGVLDVPFFFAKLYFDHGIFLRALGDHAHFKVPFWGSLLEKFGAVDGTPAICSQLMANGEAILVFPGGGREVAKRKGERYQLIWKNRIGFARLAIQHGCTIVPFSSLGVEEMFDIVLDGNDVLRTPVGAYARKLGLREEFLMPLVTPPRSFERFYFHIGEPIPTRHYAGNASREACHELRDRTRAAVERGLVSLEHRRARDPQRHLGARLLRRSA